MALLNNDDELDETELTQEERDLLNQIEGGQSTGAGVGGAAGTALGALAGGLIAGIPTAGAGAIPGASLGAGIGGSIGTALGSWIGGSQAESAEAKLEALRQKKQKELLDKANKSQIASNLLGSWISTKGL